MQLIAELYSAADSDLKSRLLACLVRPLGLLSLVAVAGGAFAGLFKQGAGGAMRVVFDDAARFSSDQIVELATFASQVDPRALQPLAALLAERPLGMAALGASFGLVGARELPQALRRRA